MPYDQSIRALQDSFNSALHFEHDNYPLYPDTLEQANLHVTHLYGIMLSRLRNTNFQEHQWPTDLGNDQKLVQFEHAEWERVIHHLGAGRELTIERATLYEALAYDSAVSYRACLSKTNSKDIAEYVLVNNKTVSFGLWSFDSLGNPLVLNNAAGFSSLPDEQALQSFASFLQEAAHPLN